MRAAHGALTHQGEHIAVVLCDVLLSRTDPEKCGPALYWFLKDKWPHIRLVLKTLEPAESTVRVWARLDQLPPPGTGTYTMLANDPSQFSRLVWLHQALFNEPPPADP
jgi:hypothetical protein